MTNKPFPVIDLAATGANILRLRKERGLSVRDLQGYFGFEEPQAIYKWQQGKSLPTVDNLYALGALLGVPMDEILVSKCPELHIIACEQQGAPAAHLFYTALEFSISGWGYGRRPGPPQPFFPSGLSPAGQGRLKEEAGGICHPKALFSSS